MKHLIALLFTFSSFMQAQTPFSQDSALSYLTTISVDIGARPMGSPNERRAMEYALQKFREFGIQETFLMEMHTAENEIMHSLVNTNSGIAYGILPGKTGRMIVIGGHIDSAEPYIPGTNDDGSGSASVLELARVLSKEAHQSTLVFCLFGGEESGLCGSKYFVDHFSQLDSVALMIELDMTNGSEILIPTIDNPSGNTPIWLVQAAYEEFAKLGYSGLKYPTDFFTAMSIFPGGGVGSDHEPFLKKNIPAIDFTSDMNDPIHTPQDDFFHFKPSGLKRSGDLAYALIHRFDNSVPEEKTSEYYLLQIGNRALIVPLWLLSVFIIVSCIIALYAVLQTRRRRIEIESSQRPKVVGLKLFLLALIIQTCVWLSENVVGLIKGVRFPWITHPDYYFVLAFLAALLGIALALRIGSRMNISKDPYRWFLRAVIFLSIILALLLLVNVKLATYPAVALFFLSCAMLTSKPWLKLVLWILSPHFMFRLIFSEGFLLLARETVYHSTYPVWMYLLVHIFYIFFFAFWSFPFLLGFAAIYFDSTTDLLWLKQWKTSKGIATFSSLFILCAIYLVVIPSYSDEWRPNIEINQSLNLNTKKAKVVLRSAEYLKHLQVWMNGKDTTISSWDREILLNEFTYDQPSWITVDRTINSVSDSNTTYDMLVKVRCKNRPEKFSLTYSSDNSLKEVSGPFVTDMTKHTVEMRWASFPDTTLMIPIHFKTTKGSPVTETIEAKFIELIEPVRIEKEGTNIIPHSTIQQTEIIRIPGKK